MSTEYLVSYPKKVGCFDMNVQHHCEKDKNQLQHKIKGNIESRRGKAGLFDGIAI